MPLLLLPFTFTANALSATTAKTIKGTYPYLELNGVKAVDLSSLLSVTIGGVKYISDSSGGMKKDNGDGTYTPVTMITLPNAGDKFDSVKTLVPADTAVYALNNTSIIPLTARKDDDGDSTFTVTGNLRGEWTDKNGTSVGSTLTGLLNTCLAPYTLTLNTTGNPTIRTQYGDPRATTYGNNSAKFTINPATPPEICHATPNMEYATGQYAGPASMWDTTMGFKVQSSYGANFPTTGSDGLSFELDVGGVDATTLKWGDASSPGASGKVVVNGITATMLPTSSSKVEVTLTGPKAASPSAFTNPTQLVLKGHNSAGTVVVDYGFNLTTWYINNTITNNASAQTTWCSGLNGTNYRIVQLKDVTNASGTAGFHGGIIPSVPNPSSGNYYQRRIGGGLFSEWGSTYSCIFDGSPRYHFVGDTTGADQFSVNSCNGYVISDSPTKSGAVVCRSQ